MSNIQDISTTRNGPTNLSGMPDEQLNALRDRLTDAPRTGRFFWHRAGDDDRTVYSAEIRNGVVVRSAATPIAGAGHGYAEMIKFEDQASVPAL